MTTRGFRHFERTPDTARCAIVSTPKHLVPNQLPRHLDFPGVEFGGEDLITLTVDPGVIGGVPLGGLDFGAAVNFSSSIDHPYQFDFIDGGGLDIACPRLRRMRRAGQRQCQPLRQPRAGLWWFHQHQSKQQEGHLLVGTFTSGGLDATVRDGRLQIKTEGKYKKFVQRVGQITFSGVEAAKREQEVLYVTERCVFRLHANGLELAEAAPGIDLKRDILDHLPFEPIVNNVREMEPGLFAAPPLRLRDRLLDLRIADRLSYDPISNTVFMNYSGMRVRTQADLDRIKAAVDELLGPLRKKVYSIVNYDRFEADADVMHAYLDLVRYVEEKYYIAVSRYTNSGFMRLKLGSELDKRKVSSRVFESSAEARDSLRRSGRTD